MSSSFGFVRETLPNVQGQAQSKDLMRVSKNLVTLPRARFRKEGVPFGSEDKDSNMFWGTFGVHSFV